MFRLIFGLDLDVGCGHAVLPNFLGGKLPAGDLQDPQFGAEKFDVAAGVEQSAERHVTADARKTIKIGEFHGNPPRELSALFKSRWRRIHSIGGDRVCQTRWAVERGEQSSAEKFRDSLGEYGALVKESKDVVNPPPPPICSNIKEKDLQNLHFVID